MPKLKKENAEMVEKIKVLENGLEIVNWYLSVMEQGVDTKEVVKKYAVLTKEHKILRKESSKTIKKLTKSNVKLTKKFESALERLSR